MGRNELDEKLLEPESIKLSITIRPVIYSTQQQKGIGNKPSDPDQIEVWHCKFEVIAGKRDRPLLRGEPSAFGWHEGERSGPHWEETKALWQKQYDYIREYIGFALLSTCESLGAEAQIACGRAAYGEVADWDALCEEITGAVAKIGWDYHEQGSEILINKPVGTRDREDIAAINRLSASSRVGNAALYYLHSFFLRLCGKAYKNAGLGYKLRFSIESLEKMRCGYDGYRKRWNLAASIADSMREQLGVEDFNGEQMENVKAAIKQACGDDMPDDLLDELKRKSRAYEPFHLAVVHIARACGVFKPGDEIEGGWKYPDAESARTIHNELSAYAKSIRKPLKENDR